MARINIFYILTILGFISLSNCYTSDEVANRINRVVVFYLYGLTNPTNQLSDGSCCGETETDKSCSPCKHELHLMRKDNTGTISDITFWTGVDSKSKYEDFMSNFYNCDSNIYISFDIEDRLEDSKTKFDSWRGIDVKAVGDYPMNGVWGNFYKTILYGVFSITTPIDTMPFASMTFTFNKIIWIKRQFSTGTPCCDTKGGSECKNACPFIITAKINNTLLWTSGVASYNGMDSSYMLKVTGGTENVAIQSDSVEITFDIFDAVKSATLIDSIVLKKITTYYNKRVISFTGVSGSNGNVKMDIDIKYNCNGFVGKNCIYPCQPINSFTDCRQEDGRRYCTNGAEDLLSCSTFNDTCHAQPCANGAKCISFDKGYYCNCKEGYGGRDCRDSTCPQLCFKGICDDNNNCNCITGYSGKWCNQSKCLDGDKLECKNGGTCIRIEDVAQCLCPTYTQSANCSVPKCTPKCKMGNCEVYKDGISLNSRCKCISGYQGIACENNISQPSIFSPKNYLWAIAALSIAIALVIKIMIVQFFIPGLEQISKREADLIQRSLSIHDNQ